MKYHLIKGKSDHKPLYETANVSLCGVKSRPDTWVFTSESNFLNHLNDEMRCKRCLQVLNKSKEEV